MNNKNVFILVYGITILGLFLLPYYLFVGKLFIGGDDTRLLYIFPWEWINNIAFYSWFHFSAFGTNNPNQALLPFLLVWSVISWLVQSKVVLDYLSFSLPLILGFIFFQKLIGQFIEDSNDQYRLPFYIGSLIYILSPITVVNQLSIFLYSVWLIGLFPIFSYYFIRYLKTGNYNYVVINALWSILLSFAVSTIPWFLGSLFPIVVGLLFFIPCVSRKEVSLFLKRSIVFFLVFVLSQAFWVFSFAINVLFAQKNSFLGTVLSSQTKDTFTPTVLSTASGNIIYPLLNLFHRQIAVDYNWSLKEIFFAFYDKTIVIDVIFILILFIAILNFKTYLYKQEKRYYVFFFIIFLLSLFLFTVNIGPLKNVFLLMGGIPGFVMFRNFYDKFALGYIFFYSLFLSLSFVVITRMFRKVRYVFFAVVFFAIIINLFSTKDVVNKIIWTTHNTYATATIPDEYYDFMSQIKHTIPNESNMLSLPFNIAGYTFIKDEDSNNIFAGRSPVQLFTAVNDFSGNLSFSPIDSSIINNDIQDRKYSQLNRLLVERNIGYVFITNNIPQQIKKSYLFDRKVFVRQDETFLNAITGQKIMQSRNGNYEIYKTKYPTSLFQSRNVVYKKINPVTYQLCFKNVRKTQVLDFLDAYSNGWKLYPEIYNSPFQSNEFSYLFKKTLFAESHKVLHNYANEWTIDPSLLKQTLSSEYYHINPDGSVNVRLTLYFEPQENFYLGAAITTMTVLISFIYILIIRRRKIQ